MQTTAGSRASAAQSGDTGKPIVRPEGAYFAVSLAILVAGAVVGIMLDDPSKGFTPKDGVSVFAGFFIAAQTIERLLEPIAPFFGRTKVDTVPSADNGDAADGDGNAAASPAMSPSAPMTGYVTKSQVLPVRDRALARCLRDPANSDAAAEAAWAQELIEQIRRNTATIWTLGSAIGMVAAGGFGLLLVHAVDATEVPRWMDVLITGIAIGGGSKPLHDLIQNVQKAKEEKENPNEADGQSAS